MTQDEIIEMYLQVSKELCNDTQWCWAGVGEPLQMFAKLVAAKEREACAELRNMLHGFDGKGRQEMVDAMNRGLDEYQALIRARSKHD